MFVVLWTSPDQSLCTRDYVPDGVHRHCHHCRPSPRRPSCAPCCPRSASPVLGVAVCVTPPSSPTVTYTTLPSPRMPTATPPSRPTSPCSLGRSCTHKSRLRERSSASRVGLNREGDAISITVAVAPATYYSFEPLPPPLLEAPEPTHQHAHGPRPSRGRHAHHQSHRHHLRDDCGPFHPGCDARLQQSAAEYRCRRGLLEYPTLEGSPVPIIRGGR